MEGSAGLRCISAAVALLMSTDGSNSCHELLRSARRLKLNQKLTGEVLPPQLHLAPLPHLSRVTGEAERVTQAPLICPLPFSAWSTQVALSLDRWRFLIDRAQQIICVLRRRRSEDEEFGVEGGQKGLERLHRWQLRLSAMPH